MENSLRDGSYSKREARLIELARQAQVGIRLTNGAGEEILVNEQWCRIAGLSNQDARNAGWLRSVHPEDRDRVEREITRSRAESTGYVLEHRFMGADGKIRWVISNGIPLEDAAGRPAGTLAAMLEVGSPGEIEHQLINATLQAGEAIRLKIRLTPGLMEQKEKGESTPPDLRRFLREEVSGAKISMHLRMIQESSERLKHTVDQILRLSQTNE